MIRSTIVLILMTVPLLGSSLEWNEHLRLKSRLVTSSERASVTQLANQGEADAQYRLGLTLFTELDIENKIPIKLVVPNDSTYGAYSSIFGGSIDGDDKRIFQWSSLQYSLDLYAILASNGGVPNPDAIKKLGSRYGVMCDPLGQRVFGVFKDGYKTNYARKHRDDLITYESIMTDTFPTMVIWMMKSAKQGHAEAMITMALLMRTANFVREGWNLEGWCNLSQDRIDEEQTSVTRLCLKDGKFLSSINETNTSLHASLNVLDPINKILQSHQEITAVKTTEMLEEASRIALQTENAEAYFKIGTVYAKPRFFYQSSDVIEGDPLYQKALQWFERAAEKEHRYALKTLGLIYRDGEGVEKNLQRAANYFAQQIVVLKKEADRGNSDSQLTLGNTYRKGFESFLPGTPAFLTKDLDKAVLYFEQSAAQGNLGALSNLKELAAMWYGDGKQEAQAALGRLNRGGDNVTNGIELEVTKNALRDSSNEQKLETTRKLKTSDNEVKRLISNYIKSLHYLGEPMSFGVCCIGMTSLPYDRNITDAQHNSNLWRITLCGPCLDCASNCLYMPFYSTCCSCVSNALCSPCDCIKHVIGSHRLSSSANQEQRKWIDSAVHLRGNPGTLHLNTGVYAVVNLFRAPPPWWDFAQEGSVTEETWHNY